MQSTAVCLSVSTCVYACICIQKYLMEIAAQLSIDVGRTKFLNPQSRKCIDKSAEIQGVKRFESARCKVSFARLFK